MTDIATRVYNHTWKIDPIVRSVLDTDFYKLLMGQMIFRRHRDVQVAFGIHNRTSRVRWPRSSTKVRCASSWIMCARSPCRGANPPGCAANMFYGKRQMFAPDYLAWLENFRFPAYHLEKRDGQYELIFEGPWIETTMWEVPALAVINELRSRAVLKGLGRFELQVLYARAMTRVWEKIEFLKSLGPVNLADFGTRRRHGFLWQDWCVQALSEGLGPTFLGTSNCLIAMRREVEATGTNAHELPMVYAALAQDDAALAAAPYEVLADWQQEYDGNLRIILRTPMAARASSPMRRTGWRAGPAFRIDSKDPLKGRGSDRWWTARGRIRRKSWPSSRTGSMRTRWPASMPGSRGGCGSVSAGGRC